MKKNQLIKFIDEFIREHRVFAPVKKGKVLSYNEITSGKEACLDFQNTKQSPKSVFFPQTEVLFEYKKDEKHFKEADLGDKEKILLGIRPCDARALLIFDKFFASGEHEDQPYLQKRERTAIIGMACNHPQSTCFCTSLGGNPFGSEGMDLQLIDLGDEYLVKILTDKGEKLVKDIKWLSDAKESDLSRARDLAEDAEDSMKPEIPTDGLCDKLDGMFNDPIWDGIHEKCIGCGVCSFLCPTCWCFDVLDEDTGNGVKRVRIWDTCQFPLFTKQGSGFNPRPSGKERMRQRIMHKFNYYPKDFDEFACVGCGRCVRECPVNLDIREVIKVVMSV